MFEGLAGKLLGFVAREFIPFVLTLLVRNGIRKVEKKLEDKLEDKHDHSKG